MGLRVRLRPLCGERRVEQTLFLKSSLGLEDDHATMERPTIMMVRRLLCAIVTFILLVPAVATVLRLSELGESVGNEENLESENQNEENEKSS